MKRPEQLHQLAREIAGILRRESTLHSFECSITPELGKWFIRALKSDNPVHALGFMHEKHRPKAAKSANRTIAAKAYALKKESPRQTWEEIATALGEKEGKGEWLRGIVHLHRDHVKSEYVVAKLSKRRNK